MIFFWTNFSFHLMNFCEKNFFKIFFFSIIYKKNSNFFSFFFSINKKSRFGDKKCRLVPFFFDSSCNTVCIICDFDVTVARLTIEKRERLSRWAIWGWKYWFQSAARISLIWVFSWWKLIFRSIRFIILFKFFSFLNLSIYYFIIFYLFILKNFFFNLINKINEKNEN